MYDLDVARIIHEFEGMRERIFFVVNEAPSRSLQRKLQNYGCVLPIGTDGLAAAIRKAASEVGGGSSISISAWDIVGLPSGTAPVIRDLDVVNFLMAGVYDESKFSNDIISKSNKLSIERSASEQIVSLMEAGNLRNVVISSNIGNGKTTIIDSVAVKLAARNFSVYRAASSEALLLKDVPLFREISGRIALIIENAFANFDLIRAIRALGRDDIFIISSARTSQFELQEGQVRSVFGGDVENFDVNQLDSKEISSLIGFLDSYALWGERQSLGRDQKERFIRSDCSCEMRFVILDILDSPNIRSRIQAILNFEGNPVARDQVRAILSLSQFLNLAQVRPSLATISELVGYDAHKAISQHSSNLRDFSLIRNGSISIRSSIFADYVLRRLIDTAFSIDVLISSMHRLDSLHDNDEKYKNLFQNFSRFRFVESAIAAEKRLVHMVNYFETIKVLSHAREHSLFWLQYAMCRLSLSQYREAERLFDVSFSYSKKAGYSDNRHLNNQYARFLLESRTNTNDYSDYISAFNKAHAICIKQLQAEPASQNPYRVIGNYEGFVKRRISELENGDIVSIVRSCVEVAKASVRNKDEIRNTRMVEETLKSVDQTVNVCRVHLKSVGYAL